MDEQHPLNANADCISNSNKKPSTLIHPCATTAVVRPWVTFHLAAEDSFHPVAQELWSANPVQHEAGSELAEFALQELGGIAREKLATPAI